MIKIMYTYKFSSKADLKRGIYASLYTGIYETPPVA